MQETSSVRKRGRLRPQQVRRQQRCRRVHANIPGMAKTMSNTAGISWDVGRQPEAQRCHGKEAGDSDARTSLSRCDMTCSMLGGEQQNQVEYYRTLSLAFGWRRLASCPGSWINMPSRDTWHRHRTSSPRRLLTPSKFTSLVPVALPRCA